MLIRSYHLLSYYHFDYWLRRWCRRWCNWRRRGRWRRSAAWWTSTDTICTAVTITVSAKPPLRATCTVCTCRLSRALQLTMMCIDSSSCIVVVETAEWRVSVNNLILMAERDKDRRQEKSPHDHILWISPIAILYSPFAISMLSLILQRLTIGRKGNISFTYWV